MLNPKRSAPFRASRTSRLSLPLPFSSHLGDLLMIAAALGAIAGIFCFFHGFSLLQQRWPSSVHRPLKPSTSSAPTAAQKTPPEPTKRAQIIQLTPQESGELSAASMTQQGRIAAALLKAGVPSPATWSTDSDRTAVRTKDPLAGENPSASSDAEVSRVLQQGATASAFRIPALGPNAPRNSSNWKATGMIWGGPALTLACIYFLVAHLGWL